MNETELISGKVRRRRKVKKDSAERRGSARIPKNEPYDRRNAKGIERAHERAHARNLFAGQRADDYGYDDSAE